MRKLLFATADPQTRGALQEALRSHQDKWQSLIVSTAEAAQDRLAETDWDAVVADLDAEIGRVILLQARESFPEVARIGVVSQKHLKVPQLAFAHQIVSDFLELADLNVAVERSCRLRDLLRGERICRTIGELGELPSAPGVYLKLLEKLNVPDTSVAEIAEIIEGDVAISAKLLQVVNSIVFRTSREIVTVKMAAGFLGLDVVKNVILSLETFQAFENLPSIPHFSLTGLQAHCRLTAAMAGRMRLAGEIRDAAIVAGLLHDIGKLVLAYKMPERFARLLARGRAEHLPLYRVEEEMWGITHAEVGAYLLGLWGLPIPVTEAIAFHHAPAAVPHRRFDTVGAVYVANLLAHEVEGSAEEREWDWGFLESLGVASQVPEWKAMAEQTASLPEQAALRSQQSQVKQRVPVV